MVTLLYTVAAGIPLLGGSVEVSSRGAVSYSDSECGWSYEKAWVVRPESPQSQSL